MYKSWMSEDLISKLDLEGLLNLNPNSIEDASLVREEILSNIDTINASLNYARFVSEHLSDIKQNIRIIDECSYLLLSIYGDWNNISILDKDLQNQIDAYFNFFDGEIPGASPIALRCTGVSMPSEPFSKVLSWVKAMQGVSLNKSKSGQYAELEKNTANGIKISSDIAKAMSNLIKYDIRNEYPDFDDSKIGAFEKIFTVTVDFESSDIEGIENALLDVKDQLECVEQIINSSV